MAGLLVAVGCGVERGPVAELVSWPVSAALNEPIRFTFDGELTPLSLTPGTVELSDGEGQPLEGAISVAGDTLTVELIVDADLVEDPPVEVQVRLLGLPSASALSLRDGRRLGRSVEARCGLQPRLASVGASPARLLSVDGMSLPLPPRVDVGDQVQLVFDGVLDPASLTPAASVLWPKVGDVTLAPLHGTPHWIVSGGRTLVRLELPAGEDLEFAMRRVQWRDLDGESPEPALVVTLSRS